MRRFPPKTWRRPAALAAAIVLVASACGKAGNGGANVAGPATSLLIGAAPTTASSLAESTTSSSEPSSTTTTAVAATSALPTTAPASPAGRPAYSGNVYAGTGANNLSPAVANARPLVYVPHEVSGDTWVIDPNTMQVVNRFPTGGESQHVVPSYDLTTLYTVAGRGNLVTPIDPATGNPGAAISVENPYNLYFMPDGSEAIVVAEGRQRFDFVDPRTFARRSSLQTQCAGLNHLDFAADYSYLIATCEFEGSMIKVDLATRKVVGKLTIDMTPSGRRGRTARAQPQDIRVSPDGSVFYVADLQSNGVYVVDAATFRQSGFIPTGVGTHALYPSRDGTKLYVINRGTNIVGGPPRGRGSVSVLDFATQRVDATWNIPGGGSPDMGNVTADGTRLWLSGRYDGEVYVFDTAQGTLVNRIKVGTNPHGLTVWPQPGSRSLGHTGNMR